jgi:GntR family transcriptional regulator
MNPVDSLDRNSPIPFYFQLQNLLLERIKSGELQPGDRLPGEHQLCAEYGVSRTVVRQALGELENEGVIRRRKGQGTFVAPHKTSEHLFERLQGLHEEARSQGREVVSRVRGLETVPAADPVAAELQIAPGDSVIRLERLRLVDRDIWTLTTSYIPHALCPGLLEEDLTTGSLYDLLDRKYGIEIYSARRSIEAALASDTVADALSIPRPPGAPLRPVTSVLVLRSTAYNAESRPVEHFVSYYPGDRARFEVTLSRRSISAAGMAAVAAEVNDG